MYSRIGKFSSVCLGGVYNSARKSSVLSQPFAYASKILSKKAMYPHSAFPPPGRMYLPPPGPGSGRYTGYDEFDEGYGESGPVHKVTCGDLRECHIGMEVELSGRVQYQRLGRFLTLRDQHGTTQVVAPDEVAHLKLASGTCAELWYYSDKVGLPCLVEAHMRRASYTARLVTLVPTARTVYSCIVSINETSLIKP